RQLEELQLTTGDLFSQPDNSLKEASIVLENLLKASNNVTLQHLVEIVIQKAGVLNYIMQSAEKPWLMECLSSFFNFVKDTCKRNPEIKLHDLLKNIKLMQKNRLSIPLHKVTATDNGINLITAHSSKGSEFEHVFVIGCVDKIWDNKKSDNRNYSYPDNLLSNTNTATDLEESRRLFYVSITRAKTNLSVSYAAKDANDKPQVKSTFVTEILQGMYWEEIKISVPDEQLTDLLALQFAEKAKPEIELVEEDYINRLLKKYSLSVTHLSNFLYCPLKFYYQNLIKVPAAKNENMMFGSAVHFALQRLFEKMKQNKDAFPTKEILLDDFNWFMQKNRDAFTPEEFTRRTIYGEKILPDYYNTHIQHWSKIVRIEHNIRNIALNDIPLNGKLDKLEFTGKLVNVVDYKTGKFENAKKKLLPPDNNEPTGGDYWRQAVFYKILMDNDKSNDWQNISTAFEFVEPVNDQYKVEKITITREDITTVSQQIKTVWQKIQNKEFKIGCGRSDCEWCNFVKTNNMAVALHELSEEETDEI
ncbi:MAG TPA: PD-(D/E)XK nuclease family protein, partial [Puia sp.]